MRKSSSIAAALLLVAVAASGCGGSTDSAPIVDRIAHQALTDAGGSPLQSWDYAYDSSGRTTQLRGYDASGVWVSTATHTYSGGLRTGTVTRDPDGVVMYSVEYAYAGGVLESAARYSNTGDLSETDTYVFSGGRKLSTTRYNGAGNFIDRREFHYDGVTGARTGSTVYDAVDTVIGSSTRTYVGGLMTEAELVTGVTTTYRYFTYETGPLTTNHEIFYEF